MKKLLVLFFSVIVYHPEQSYSQTLHIDSTRFITGIVCCVGISSIIPTDDKGIFFAGYEWNHPIGIIPYCAYAGYNVMVGKIDSNRQISWIRVYGGNGDDQAVSGVQTLDGGYAILTETASNDGDVTGGYKGYGDLWQFRLDGSGNLLWGKTYGSSNQDHPISIANTPDHGFVILGSTNGSDGDVPFHYAGVGYWDWILIKTDSVGNKEWSKDLGGNGNEGWSFTHSAGTILYIDTSYYLISTSSSTDHDCIDTTWHSGDTLWNAYYNNGDYYVVKLDNNGNRLWSKSYGGTGGDYVSQAIFDFRDSTIVIVGSTNSSNYMVTGFQGGWGFGDIWVVKVDMNGALIWQKTLGTPYDDEGTSICLGPNGGYLAYGWTHNGTIGQEYLSIFSLDKNGNELVNRQFGGPVHTENYSNIIFPYLNGYVASGKSGARAFTEGTTYGKFDTSGLDPNSNGSFICYIDTEAHTAVYNINKPSEHIITLSPNPVKTFLTISSTNRMKTIDIIDIFGQNVYRQQCNSSQIQVDVDDLPAGVYVVRINGTEIRKFVKQ
jgi:Secretion system C-terminal sorting domain